MFMLPKATISLIERSLRAFLWKGSDLKMGGAKVAWIDICCPKMHWGLGILNLILQNQACNLKQLWHLLTDSSESIWLDWVRKNLVRGRQLWNMKIATNASWS